MVRFRKNAFFVSMIWLVLAGSVSAQQNPPRIGFAFPAGGRQGTTFRVTLGGQFLEGVTGATVSGTGVQATIVEHIKPITQQQFNDLREKLKELQDRKAAATGKSPLPGQTPPGNKPPLNEKSAAADKTSSKEKSTSQEKSSASDKKKASEKSSPAEKATSPEKAKTSESPTPSGKTASSPQASPLGTLKHKEKLPALEGSGTTETPPAVVPKPTWTAEDEKKLAEIRQKIAAYMGRPQNPALAESVTIEVTIAPHAEPGERDLRLIAPAGITNPLVFCVGQLPEVCRELTKAFRQPGDGRMPKVNRAESEISITLPAVVNGQIMPGAVDRVRFKAKKGTRLVAVVKARSLIPYLADAVPGWFQATLALYDSQGNELAFNDDYRFQPDPILYFIIPRDGEYVVEIRDSIYRGREDFIYRIALGEFPFVTGIFPLGGPLGEKTSVALKGWNLASNTSTQDNTGKSPGVYPLGISPALKIFNSVPFAVDSLPETLEKEPNNTLAEAQKIALPIIINGRIDRPADHDTFAFEGHQGEKIVAEIFARRLGSPLDSFLKLTDASGRQLAFNDDHEDKGSGLNTHHADSWLSATLPSDGTYHLRVSDAQHKGGPEFAYRLRLSPPRPDFELRIVPSALNTRAGTNIPMTVYALRRDGFSGSIALSLKDAPAGFAISGGTIPAQQDSIRCTLTVPRTPLEKPVTLHLEGSATIDGKETRHSGIPADDLMQAFFYRHLVPAHQTLVSVAPRPRLRAPFKIQNEPPLKFPLGQAITLRVVAPAGPIADQVQLSLSEPPPGISLQKVTRENQSLLVSLQADPAKVKAGLQGNLTLEAYMEKTPESKDGKPPKNKIQRISLGFLPAVPFEVGEAEKK